MYIEESPGEISSPPVIAQQYSSATFVSLHFISREEQHGACSRNDQQYALICKSVHIVGHSHHV
jgi:hypothetical protein